MKIKAPVSRKSTRYYDVVTRSVWRNDRYDPEPLGRASGARKQNAAVVPARKRERQRRPLGRGIDRRAQNCANSLGGLLQFNGFYPFLRPEPSGRARVFRSRKWFGSNCSASP